MLSHAEMVQLEIQKDREQITQFTKLYFELRKKYSLVFYEENVDLFDLYDTPDELRSHLRLR